jgi:hypothetical protein
MISSDGWASLVRFCGMKVIKIDARPDLEALVKGLYSNGESGPIFLEDKGKQVGVIMSPVEYRILGRVEEVLSEQA